MNPEDVSDQELRSLQAADEALATGQSSVDTSLKDHLQRDLAFLRRVRRALSPSVPTPAGAESPASTPATTLIGRFQLRRELGRGAFGVVFLAYDPLLGREVALKVPRAEILVSPELRRRFRREGKAAAGLDHPNLVSVYEAGEAGPILLPGDSLLSRPHADPVAAAAHGAGPFCHGGPACGDAGRGGGVCPPAWRGPPRSQAEQYPADV